MNEYASLLRPHVNLSWTDAAVNIKLQSKALFAFLVAEKQIRKIRLSDTAQINAVTEDNEHKINLISLARKWAIFCKACVIATITHIYAKADKLVIFLLTCWACWWQMVDLIFLDLGYFGGMRVCAYIYFFFGQPSLKKSALAVSFKGVGLLLWGGCPSSKRSKQEPLL